MTAFFVSSWFRVAGLRPFLQEHVKAERHRYGRQSWYALHDRLTGRVHRVTPAAFLFAVRMDGKRTVDEIWQELVTELDADAPGQELVLRLLSQLHHADLLAGDLPPDATELLKRRGPAGAVHPAAQPAIAAVAADPVVRPGLVVAPRAAVRAAAAQPVRLPALARARGGGRCHGRPALGRADGERRRPGDAHARVDRLRAVLPRHQGAARIRPRHRRQAVRLRGARSRRDAARVVPGALCRCDQLGGPALALATRGSGGRGDRGGARTGGSGMPVLGGGGTGDRACGCLRRDADRRRLHVAGQRQPAAALRRILRVIRRVRRAQSGAARPALSRLPGEPLCVRRGGAAGASTPPPGSAA